MQSVKLIACTQPLIEGINTPEDFIVYTARVSNPQNQMNTLTAPKLLKYLLKNKHFSPFEMINLVFDVQTTRDIGRQILRHSLKFQEFSLRYSEPNNEFVEREARLQDSKNRQNSIETDDDFLKKVWFEHQALVHAQARVAYDWAINNGIAKEQARVVLPEGLTETRMYASGTLRNFIHYIQVRFHPGTQKEHREIASMMMDIICDKFPSLYEYLNEMVEDNFKKEER